MKIAILIGPFLLAAAASAHAQTQAPDAARQALQQAATGDAFRIGYTQFRLAPDGVVSAAAASAGPSAVRVGDYAVQLRPAAARSARAVAAPRRLAAAVGDDGKAVVVTSTLNVYHRDPAALQAAVRASGGTLVYASVAGGNGRIEFASVDAAMRAMATIQAIAGIKEVAPEIIEGDDAPT